MDNPTFFNENVDIYAAKQIYDYDNIFINVIISQCNKEKRRVVDIGGGSGLFASALISQNPALDISIIDPSEELLRKVAVSGIKKIIGSLPNEIDTSSTYDFVHIKEVLHHIPGSTIAECKHNVADSLKTLNRIMDDEGYLLIHDLYYESLIYPELTRDLIYHLLHVQDKVGIRLPSPELLLGLEVCFFTRSELKQMITDSGFIIEEYHEYPWTWHTKAKLMMIRNWGRMLFVCRKA